MLSDDHRRLRFFRPVALALSLGLLVSACQAEPHGEPPPSSAAARQVSIGGIRWYVDYAAALEVARAEDKALWVHFGENPG